MKENELEALFERLLNRKPSWEEIIWHLNKKTLEFENEVFDCHEYKQLQQKKKTDPHCKIAILLSRYRQHGHTAVAEHPLIDLALARCRRVADDAACPGCACGLGCFA